MTRPDAEVAFERALFDSARNDGPSEARKRAAYRALVASGAVVGTAGGALVHGRGPFSAGTAKAAAWLATGALLGTAITLALVERRAPSATVPSAPVVERRAPRATVPSAPVVAPHVPRVTAPPVATVSAEASLATPKAAPTEAVHAPDAASSVRAHNTHQPQPAARAATERPTPESTLSREVAALDRARSALWQRDFEGALQRVEAFHAEFPSSPLAPDAESLAIEALRGRGDTAAAARRAERFLLRYPNDPQTGRVRETD